MSANATGRLSDDLEFWMTNLSVDLKQIPIINLAIPGSHDSMSYGINKSSPVAPDADPIVADLYRYVPCIVRRWAITQSLTITDQLRRGVRYFDFRISMNRDEFYFVHGLYCEDISEPLKELIAFLDSHPSEFVIIDCQHFYNFTEKDHARLSNKFLDIFGSRLYEELGNTLPNCTLYNMNRRQKQILIIYRNADFKRNEFFASEQWPTPWPNKIKIDKLKQYLDESLLERDPNCGYVTQCVLTPDVKFIVPRFFSSLRTKCAQPVCDKLSKWIAQQTPGPFAVTERPKANVFLADFIDIKDSNFCKIVVDLNMKIANTNCNHPSEITRL